MWRVIIINIFISLLIYFCTYVNQVASLCHVLFRRQKCAPYLQSGHMPSTEATLLGPEKCAHLNVTKICLSLSWNLIFRLLFSERDILWSCVCLYVFTLLFWCALIRAVGRSIYKANSDLESYSIHETIYSLLWIDLRRRYHSLSHFGIFPIILHSGYPRPIHPSIPSLQGR